MPPKISRPLGLARRLRVVERLMYVLPLVPVLTDIIELGRLPNHTREWLSETVAAALIAAFILLLRKARKDIEAIDGLRKNLTQVLIHDLKNPLASVIAGVSALMEKGAASGSVKLLGVILRSAKAQSALIDTLLDLDRIENDEIELKPNWQDMGKLLEGCIEEAGAAAQGRGVRIENRSAATAERIRADEELLRRVLMNLLSNALKYTPDEGVVSVRAVREDGRFVFEIEDSGPGVPPEQLDRLFGKFYRVEGRDQSRRRGTGLGLYFCKLAVEAHGGRIAAENAPSGGLRVRFDLPQPAGAVVPEGQA